MPGIKAVGMCFTVLPGDAMVEKGRWHQFEMFLGALPVLQTVESTQRANVSVEYAARNRLPVTILTSFLL